MAKQSGWTHALSLDISDTSHYLVSSLLHVSYSSESFTPVNPNCFLVQKEAKLTFVLTWTFVSAYDLLFTWRHAVSQLLLNATRIKNSNKGKNLERYLEQQNTDSPIDVSRKMVQIPPEQQRDARKLLAGRVKTAYENNFREEVPSHSILEQILSHILSSEVYTAFGNFNTSINHYQNISDWNSVDLWDFTKVNESFVAFLL